jgi:membrane-bound ClpP family serine protease
MEYHHKYESMKLLILGIAIILLDIYTQLDLWLVIGVLLILKAIWVTLIPAYAYHNTKLSKPKRR